MKKQSFVITVYLLLLLSGIGLLNCTHDPLTPLEDAPLISFKDDVQPLVVSNCTQSGCHGKNGGEFPLTTYEEVIGKISAGNPHSSKFYKVITANAIGAMPPKPNPHLTDTEIKTIYLWIAQGANNN